MKLKANNFTGHLSNGNRYKIETQSNYNEFEGTYLLKIVVAEFIVDGWFVDSDYTVEQWYRKGEYMKALRSGLLELENKLRIQLLQAELVAVA